MRILENFLPVTPESFLGFEKPENQIALIEGFGLTALSKFILERPWPKSEKARYFAALSVVGFALFGWGRFSANRRGAYGANPLFVLGGVVSCLGAMVFQRHLADRREKAVLQELKNFFPNPAGFASVRKEMRPIGRIPNGVVAKGAIGTWGGINHFLSAQEMRALTSTCKAAYVEGSSLIGHAKRKKIVEIARVHPKSSAYRGFLTQLHPVKLFRSLLGSGHSVDDLILISRELILLAKKEGRIQIQGEEFSKHYLESLAASALKDAEKMAKSPLQHAKFLQVMAMTDEGRARNALVANTERFRIARRDQFLNGHQYQTGLEHIAGWNPVAVRGFLDNANGLTGRDFYTLSRVALSALSSREKGVFFEDFKPQLERCIGPMAFVFEKGFSGARGHALHCLVYIDLEKGRKIYESYQRCIGEPAVALAITGRLAEENFAKAKLFVEKQVRLCHWGRAYAEIVAHLKPDQMDEALFIASKIHKPELRAEALLKFASKAPEQYREWIPELFSPLEPKPKKERVPTKRGRLEEGKRRAPPPGYTPGPGPEDEHASPVRPLDWNL